MALTASAQDLVGITPIETIDPTSDIDADLAPIGEAVAGARVVVLGEATHGDGATAAAKARVARYLYEHHGFDVIMWEAGELDCARMNDALRRDIPIGAATRRMMQNGWDSTEQIRPLFELARASQQTDRPMDMAGFDIPRMPYGPTHYEELLSQLTGITEVEISDVSAAHLSNLIRRTAGRWSESAYEPADRLTERGILRQLIREVTARESELIEQMGAEQAAFNVRQLRQLAAQETISTIHYQGRIASEPARAGTFFTKWNLQRDAMMAESILWQLRNRFADRKVMIWAATAHFVRAIELIRKPGADEGNVGWIQAGDWLDWSLADEMYVLAFTSGGGTYGDVFIGEDVDERGIGEIPALPPGSVEAVMGAEGHAYAFVDLRQLDREHPLRAERVSTCLGLDHNLARWDHHVDGFFFVAEQEPNRLIRHRPQAP